MMLVATHGNLKSGNHLRMFVADWKLIGGYGNTFSLPDKTIPADGKKIRSKHVNLLLDKTKPAMAGMSEQVKKYEQYTGRKHLLTRYVDVMMLGYFMKNTLSSWQYLCSCYHKNHQVAS